MAFRFLHLADLHLETSFGGRPRTKERLRQATLQAFASAVDFALERGLHAVLAAGDLFDDKVLSLSTARELSRQVRRLTEAGTSFLCVAGNHDPGGRESRGALLEFLGASAAGAFPGRIHAFRNDDPETVVVTDRAGRPVGRVVGAGHPEPVCPENLAARFPRAADLGRELPLVGLLHTQVVSARDADRHVRYAPSRAEDFERTGYDYWALGHVHLRQQAVPGLPVWYAGNLQGRNPRESGAKGGLCVAVEAGLPAEPEFVELAPVRWERARAADLGELATVEALYARLAALIEQARGGREAIVVVELAGPSPLARRLLRTDERVDLAADLERETGALEVDLRVDELRLPADESGWRMAPSALARALELLERAGADDELLEALAPATLAREPELASREARLDYLRELALGLDRELWLRLAPEAP